jgi:hypothetical protein
VDKKRRWRAGRGEGLKGGARSRAFPLNPSLAFLALSQTPSHHLPPTPSLPPSLSLAQCIAAVLYQRIQGVARGLRKMARKCKAGDTWDVYGNEWDHFNDVPRARTAQEVAAPTHAQINDFILRIYTKAQMERDSIIIALIYIERLLNSAVECPLKLGPHNWMTVLFCGLLISSKVLRSVASVASVAWRVARVVVAHEHVSGARGRKRAPGGGGGGRGGSLGVWCLVFGRP